MVNEARKIFVVALCIRIIVTIVGCWLDTQLEGIQYTDIDYHVFSDAARLISEGASPYERSTFRYPPVIAMLLVPNIWLPCFGKLAFSLFDAAIAVEVYQFYATDRNNNATYYGWLWAFNIASINICTRGSADSITNYLVVLILRILTVTCPTGTAHQHHPTSALAVVGFLYGALIYLRIYPIIYGPAVVVYLWSTTTVRSTYAHSIPSPSPFTRVAQTGSILKHSVAHVEYLANQQTLTAVPSVTSASLPPVSVNQLWRSVGSVLVFIFCTASSLAFVVYISHYMYGNAYWENAVQYHWGREDHRHNFSLHFYGIYLSKGLCYGGEGGGANANVTADVETEGVMMACSRYGDLIVGELNRWWSLTFFNLSTYYRYWVFLDAFPVFASPMLHSLWNQLVNVVHLVALKLTSTLFAFAAAVPMVVLFLPQAVLFVCIIAIFAAGNLPVCLLLQTMIFVAYNKVITAQYFSWYLCLLPLCAPSLMCIPKGIAAGSISLWLLATGYWLYQAYNWEFLGLSNFYVVWTASVYFHFASMLLIGVVAYYAPRFMQLSKTS